MQSLLTGSLIGCLCLHAAFAATDITKRQAPSDGGTGSNLPVGSPMPADDPNSPPSDAGAPADNPTVDDTADRQQQNGVQSNTAGGVTDDKERSPYNTDQRVHDGGIAQIDDVVPDFDVGAGLTGDDTPATVTDDDDVTRAKNQVLTGGSVLVPGVVQPGLVQPGMLQPGLLQPGLMSTGMVPPGLLQGGVIQPGLLAPGVLQSGLLQPGLQQPGINNLIPGAVGIQGGVAGQIPTTGLIRDPLTGLLRDPVTGFVQNPATGLLQNPNLGLLRNPNLGLLQNPNLGLLQNPNLGLLQNPNLGLMQNTNLALLRRNQLMALQRHRLMLLRRNRFRGGFNSDDSDSGFHRGHLPFRRHNGLYPNLHNPAYANTLLANRQLINPMVGNIGLNNAGLLHSQHLLAQSLLPRRRLRLGHRWGGGSGSSDEGRFRGGLRHHYPGMLNNQLALGGIAGLNPYRVGVHRAYRGGSGNNEGGTTLGSGTTDDIGNVNVAGGNSGLAPVGAIGGGVSDDAGRLALSSTSTANFGTITGTEGTMQLTEAILRDFMEGTRQLSNLDTESQALVRSSMNKISGAVSVQSTFLSALLSVCAYFLCR